jgi:hypothetical protein
MTEKCDNVHSATRGVRKVISGGYRQANCCLRNTDDSLGQNSCKIVRGKKMLSQFDRSIFYWRAAHFLWAVGAIFGATPAFAAHDFTIQGKFTCTAQGVTMPVEGAIVGIMRDKPWAADPIVTEVRTLPDGSFTAQVHAKDVDKYYAKLFLNDKEGVYLRDWWTLSVREYNSANRGQNKTAELDLGTSNISRDSGSGTPHCAVWQGGRRAWQEYVASTGQRPLIGDHGNYQIVMETTASNIVWTSRDTTHWEIGSGTGGTSTISPVSNPAQLTYADLFQLYGTNVHEFGHALRQTADGSDAHFSWDATRFFYGHSHDLCNSSPAGVIGNPGYGFNEGWADYRQGQLVNVLQSCHVSPRDFNQESAVALDLDALQNTLGVCAGIPPGISGDELLRRQRALMFQMLAAAGHEKIHSELDFRAAFYTRFPTCHLPTANSPLAQGSASAPTTTTKPLNGETSRPINRPVPSLLMAQAKLAVFPSAIDRASRAAEQVSPSLPASETVDIVTLPALLRGQMALAKLLATHLAPAAAQPPSAAVLMTVAGQQRRNLETASFDRDARAITLTTLTNERAALLKGGTSNADDVSLLDTEIAAVRAGNDRASAILLKTVADDTSDTVSTRIP